MKTKITKKQKITLFIAMILVAGGFGGGAFIFAKKKHLWNNQTNEAHQEEKKEEVEKIEEKTDEISKEEDSKNEENVGEVSNQQTATSNSAEEKENITNTDRATPESDTLTGATIYPVYANVDAEGGTVSISAQISGLNYDNGDGSCTITLSSAGGASKVLQSEILESPGNKYCKRVEISKSELGAGQWSAVIEYKNSTLNYQGKSNAENFEI